MKRIAKVGGMTLALLLIGAVASGQDKAAEQTQNPRIEQEKKAEGSLRGAGYDELQRPKWLMEPHHGITAEQDSVPVSIRAARNKHFDTPGSKPLESYAPGEKPTNGVVGNIDFYELDPYPKKLSDAIVIGQAVSAQPFLSSDKSSVYSDLSISTFRILKDDTGTLKVRQPLTISQRGGTLRLQNGRLLSSVPFGGSNPLPLMKRELLFLHYNKTTQSFSVLRAWDLSHPTPVALDNDGHPYGYKPEDHGVSVRSQGELETYVSSH